MSELPAGWAETTLGAIGSVQSGMGFPLEMQGQTEGVYPVYKVGDVSRGVLLDRGILRRSTNYVDAEAAAILKGHIFPEGSILFAKIGEALRLNRRAIVFREGLADNNVMGFKADQGIDDGFLYHFLRTQDLASLSRSTTIPPSEKVTSKTSQSHCRRSQSKSASCRSWMRCWPRSTPSRPASTPCLPCSNAFVKQHSRLRCQERLQKTGELSHLRVRRPKLLECADSYSLMNESAFGGAAESTSQQYALAK